MAIGGNGRARQFFKQHGWDELGADKIESKVCKCHHRAGFGANNEVCTLRLHL